MQRFEYKVIPAPRRAEKVRGAKTSEDRFAHTLTQLMNDLGREGWEYLRADTLPCEERVGFTGRSTSFQNMLVFRRVLGDEASALPAASGAMAPVVEGPRVGSATSAAPGAAPALGPARPELAAE